MAATTQEPPETTVPEDSPPLEVSALLEDSLALEDSAAAEGSELVEDSPALEDSVDDDFAVSVEAALGAAVAALSFVLELAALSLCELEPVDAVPLAVELPASVVVDAALTVLPENVWAATADSTPVAVTLPAMSQRFMRVSLRSAASLDFTS